MAIYDEMQVKRGDTYEDLTSEPVVLFDATRDVTKEPFPWSPIVLAFSVFIFIWSLWEYIRLPNIVRFTRLFDFALFALLGFLGLTIIGLWTGSLHTAFDANWNVLWANPLFLLVAAGCFKRTWGPGLRGLVVVLMILLVLTVLFGGVIIGQDFPKILLPIVIILVGRILVLLKRK
jgi:hypothetical protein